MTEPIKNPVGDNVYERVQSLLEANNFYLSRARAAESELRAAVLFNKTLARQLVVLTDALEFYADENNYDEMGVVGTFTKSHDPTSVGSGPETETNPDLGTTAEHALQDVMGDKRG